MNLPFSLSRLWGPEGRARRCPTAAKRVLAPALAAVLAFPSSALAHHSPGHAGTESLRTLASSGAEPAPRQRIALVSDVLRTSDQPTLNTATIGALSVVASYRVVPRLYLGVQAPFVLVDEDATPTPKVGYGDTRFTSHFVLGDLDDKSRSWTLGLNVSVPTRTIFFAADPGRQWSLSPLVSYSWAGEKFRFFAMLLTPLELRPAGTALEVSPSAGVGYQITPWLSSSLAIGADVRVLSLCSGPEGSRFCSGGRASEHERELGATRLYGSFTTWLGLSSTWSLFGSVQLPVTEKRDFEFSASLGLEARL